MSDSYQGAFPCLSRTPSAGRPASFHTHVVDRGVRPATEPETPEVRAGPQRPQGRRFSQRLGLGHPARHLGPEHHSLLVAPHAAAGTRPSNAASPEAVMTAPSAASAQAREVGRRRAGVRPGGGAPAGRGRREAGLRSPVRRRQQKGAGMWNAVTLRTRQVTLDPLFLKESLTGE